MSARVNRNQDHVVVYVPRGEAETLRRKIDLIAVSRGLLSEGGRRPSTPNRSAAVWALVEEAFAGLPEASMSDAEQEAYLAPFLEEYKVTDEDVVAAVEATGGDAKEAARQLGMSYDGVRYRMLRMGLWEGRRAASP